jgi:uncharacterized protein with GYD domain
MIAVPSRALAMGVATAWLVACSSRIGRSWRAGLEPRLDLPERRVAVAPIFDDEPGEHTSGYAGSVVASLGRLPHTKLHRGPRRRKAMVTYVVLAKFTDQGIRHAKDSPKRADAFKEMAKTFGVTVKDIVWTQGRYDIVTVIEAPDESSAMSLNLSLGALGNIRTETLRAFSAPEMTKIVGKML